MLLRSALPLVCNFAVLSVYFPIVPKLHLNPPMGPHPYDVPAGEPPASFLNGFTNSPRHPSLCQQFYFPKGPNH